MDETTKATPHDSRKCPAYAWIPRSEQNKNKVKTIRLSAWGEEKTLLDWMNDDRCTVAYDTILYRVKNGVAHDVAMTHKGRMKILKHN